MEDKNQENRIGERKEYYTNKFSKYLNKYPDNFKDFVGDTDITNLANELMSKGISTGCNVATFTEFPINSNNSLIFYGVYKQRVEHFGQLLAIMEQRKIIDESDVTFGIRGTKVLGDWNDEECIKGKLITTKGEVKETRESVEAVLVFQPSPEKVEAIVEFLVGEAPRLDGGYEVPDIRTTATYELRQQLVENSVFKIAKANVFSFGDINLIALTPKPISRLVDKSSNALNSLLNPELFEFISVVDF